MDLFLYDRGLLQHERVNMTAYFSCSIQIRLIQFKLRRSVQICQELKVKYSVDDKKTRTTPTDLHRRCFDVFIVNYEQAFTYSTIIIIIIIIIIIMIFLATKK